MFLKTINLLVYFLLINIHKYNIYNFLEKIPLRKKTCFLFGRHQKVFILNI
jgi:hypothetical protein